MSTESPSRKDELEIHTVADGYIVYDKETDRVHYLNQTASLILELCDGSHDHSEISSLVKQAFDLDVAPVEDTRDVLSQFAKEGLTQ